MIRTLPHRHDPRRLALRVGVLLALALALVPDVLLHPVHGQQLPQNEGSLFGGGANGATAPSGTVGAGGNLILGAPPVEPGQALEQAISGQSYTLGPGDVLTISIWGPQSFTYSVPVTLEGEILLPSMGPLRVDGLPLDEARETIRRRILRDFKNVDVTVSLTQLRKFQIHVLGRVERPGTYLGSAVDRVSSAVGWAGGLSENASQRRILVRGRQGLRARADLFAFLQRGVSSDNPFLQDGDIVYVDYATDRVEVSGAVHQSGFFEFLPGDRLSEALFFAGGLTNEAFLDTLELVRYPSDGSDRHRYFLLQGGGIVPADEISRAEIPPEIGRFTPSGGETVAEAAPDYPDVDLRSSDLVFVRLTPEQRRRKLVQVAGEVEFPGFYPVLEGRTRLSEVIAWAGGVTDRAFLEESTVIRRESIRIEDREFERLSTIPVADMTVDEYEYFKVRSRETQGLMVVDFRAVLLENDPEEDIVLRPGDIINLATRRDFISVIGMVGEPGNIPFDGQLGPKAYIQRAGGYAEGADQGKIRVIRAGTGEWVRLGEVEGLGPGDTIWVPEEPERDYWGVFRDVLAVTTQILTIYLIVDRATQ